MAFPAMSQCSPCRMPTTSRSKMDKQSLLGKSNAPGHRKFTAGAAYRNGKLYEFTSSRVTVMKGWPLMLAWQWSEHKPRWVHVRPNLRRISLKRLAREKDPDRHPPEPNGQMLLPFACSLVAGRAYRAFWRSVPAPVREMVMPFLEGRWQMLALLARCPGAEDLARNNPALAFCLASNGSFHWPKPSRPLRAARALVFRKQRRILEWLGFPGTESARQALRRVPPETMSEWFFRDLRRALWNPGLARQIGFLDRINECVLSVLMAPAGGPTAAFALLEEIAHDPHSDWSSEIARGMEDIGRLCEELHRPLPRLSSIARVVEVHAELTGGLNGRLGEDDANNKGPLPPPPLPGKEGEIEPLVSRQELVAEGRLQHHCVGSYSSAVRSGRIYVYRMLKPERATLAIALGSAGWVLREIHGFQNSGVRPESMKAVLDWLMDQQPPDMAAQVLSATQNVNWADDPPF